MQHYTLTLSSSTPKRLSDVFGASYQAGNVLDVAFGRIEVQPDKANTDLVYLGGTNATLTASDYGTALPPPTSVTAMTPPWIREKEGGMRLSEIYALAAVNNEKIHIFVEGLR